MWLRPDAPSASTPPDTRVYAVGDVHGRLDLLDRLHRSIEEDAAAAGSRKVAVHLGDYVDRGPDSAGALTALAMAGGERRFLATQFPRDSREWMSAHRSSLACILRRN